MNKNGGSFIVNHASHFVNGLQRNIFTAGDMPLPVFVRGTNIQQDCAIRSAIFFDTLIDVRAFQEIEESIFAPPYSMARIWALGLAPVT